MQWNKDSNLRLLQAHWAVCMPGIGGTCSPVFFWTICPSSPDIFSFKNTIKVETIHTSLAYLKG